MWQAPNQRIRAQANARKRERDRYKIPFHIKRVVASVQLQIPGRETERFDARTLLNDFSPRGMGLFSAHKFSQGDEVLITIESPEKIQVKGRVSWCQEYYVAGKVLKTQSFSYRAGVQFVFSSAEEQEAVKNYCDALLNTHHCVSLRHDRGEADVVAPPSVVAPAAAAPANDAAPAEAAGPAAEAAPAPGDATPAADANAATDAAAASEPKAA